MPNSISTHISSLIGIVVSAIAVLHPGFTISPTVTALIVSIGGGGALVLQLAHVHLKSIVLKAESEYNLLVKSLSAKVPAPLVSVVDAVAKTAVTDVKALVNDKISVVVPKIIVTDPSKIGTIVGPPDLQVIKPEVPAVAPAVGVAASVLPEHFVEEPHAEGSNNIPLQKG